MGFGEDLEKILSKLDNRGRNTCDMVAGIIRGIVKDIQRAIALYSEAMTSFELSDKDAHLLVIQAETTLPNRNKLRWLIDDVSKIVGDKVVTKVLPDKWLNELSTDLEELEQLIKHRSDTLEVYMKANEITNKWLIRYCDVHRRCAEMMSQGGGSNG